MNQYLILVLIALVACWSVLVDDERIGRTLLATAVCFITIWLVWFY